ncbi:hypothetical protein OH768_24545 [Streptomyces sp. NBC_01622]|nr:hypothetical protein OH768_24545 [Streptomyces sp. NBC_01622]
MDNGGGRAHEGSAADTGTRTMARALPAGAAFTHPGVLVSKG